MVTFWKEFSSGNPLVKWEYLNPEPLSNNRSITAGNDNCTVMNSFRLAPKASEKTRFVLAWNVPNCCNYWSEYRDVNGEQVIWRNYYSTLFQNAQETASYCLSNFHSLLQRTLSFQKILHGSTLDPAVIDRVSANLAVLKSPSILRVEDGSLWGWEGTREHKGSCEGTCQHVWNYVYSLCFLFPDLDRSILDLQFQYNTDEHGKTVYRIPLPLGRSNPHTLSCLDGQMGLLIKAYRDFKLSGDLDYLKRNWNTLKRILEYAWSDHNEHRWDHDKDGVLEGRQHHTLDRELFGPSSWLEGLYLCALKAGAELASWVGDREKQDQYHALHQKGRRWTAENLFNGSHFIQKIDLKDKSLTDRFGCSDRYWNMETGEITAQIGEGSAIDQIVAQWHSDIVGLGSIFEENQVRSALSYMFAHNFKKSMREVFNPWRSYALNDESGSVICDYAPGKPRPANPIPYYSETMTGFEYAFACLLIRHGMTEAGLELVRGLRDRFNGYNRNPWNEFECGSNYVRSMASFALIPTFSGFSFDIPNHTIGFAPAVPFEQFRSFWSVATAWGEFSIEENLCTIRIAEGSVALSSVTLPFVTAVTAVTLDTVDIPYDFQDGNIRFEKHHIFRDIQIVFSRS